METLRRNRYWAAFTARSVSWTAATHSFACRSASMAVVPEHAAVVREVFRLFAVEELTCRTLCRHLTEVGVPTAKTGACRHPSTLQRMLTNTAYVGRFMYGRNEAVEPQRPSKAERPNRKSSRRPLPPEHWDTIPCPPIVDEAVFGQAQAKLAANALFSPRNNTRHPYLLRGLIRCGRCGGAYRQHSQGGGRTRAPALPLQQPRSAQGGRTADLYRLRPPGRGVGRAHGLGDVPGPPAAGSVGDGVPTPASPG